MNFTDIGFGLFASGRPLRTALEPVYVRDLPNAGLSSSGLKPSDGWPLNQNGASAASSEPETSCPSGVMMGSLLVRFPGRSIVWNPVGANFTVSPTWIVTWCGKKSLTSLPVFWNCFWAAVGSPASTVFVAACAAAAENAGTRMRTIVPPSTVRTRLVMRAPLCRCPPPPAG